MLKLDAVMRLLSEPKNSASACHTTPLVQSSKSPWKLKMFSPLVFDAQTCHKDALYVGWTLANAPFPPSLPVEPVDGVLPDLGLWRAAATRGTVPYVGPD